VNYMVKQWCNNAIQKERRFWDIPYENEPYEPFTQSFSQLVRAIQDTTGDNKRVNRTIVSNHVKRMVKEGTLHRNKKNGKHHPEYRLCREKLIAYLEYLDSLFLRRILERIEGGRYPCCVLSWVYNEDFELEIKWTPNGGVPETKTISFPASRTQTPPWMTVSRFTTEQTAA
jgi:DNA-binding HxlR family transcriptional regulator